MSKTHRRRDVAEIYTFVRPGPREACAAPCAGGARVRGRAGRARGIARGPPGPKSAAGGAHRVDGAPA